MDGIARVSNPQSDKDRDQRQRRQLIDGEIKPHARLRPDEFREKTETEIGDDIELDQLAAKAPAAPKLD